LKHPPNNPSISLALSLGGKQSTCVYKCLLTNECPKRGKTITSLTLEDFKNKGFINIGLILEMLKKMNQLQLESLTFQAKNGSGFSPFHFMVHIRFHIFNSVYVANLSHHLKFLNEVVPYTPLDATK
jgi:hypothetical protein